MENYNKLLEKAKEAYSKCASNAEKRRLESIFPELAFHPATTEDEGIRKDLIEFVKQYGDNFYGQFSKASAISWLEKQGKNDNFFNKIQIGDKVTRNEDGVLVNLSQLERVANENEGEKETNKVELCFDHSPELEEQDIDLLESIIECIDGTGLLDSDQINWLKSLDALLKKQGEQKSVWSEEDRGFVDLLLAVFTNEHPNGIFSTGSIPVFKGNCVPSYRIIDWLKSLEAKFKVPVKDDKKETDNVGPTFKPGDWITREDFHPALILNVYADKGNKYEIEYIDGGKGLRDIDFIDKYYHLWTIEDAKDGDVLAIGNTYFLFKGETLKSSPESPVVYISHCMATSIGAFRVTDRRDCCKFQSIENGIKAFPATREQRNILFQRIKDAGYKWDAEKKELICKINKL